MTNYRIEDGQRGNIEIYFDERPSADIRLKLKAAGFRWHATNECWFGKFDKTKVDSLLNGEVIVKFNDK